MKYSPLTFSVVASIFLVSSVSGQTPDGALDRLTAFIEQRKTLDATVWGNEVLAQHYEERFVILWDQLRSTEEKLKLLGGFPFDEFVMSSQTKRSDLGNGISRSELSGSEHHYSPIQAKQTIDRLISQGFKLEQTEWHHQSFAPNSDNTARSEVSFKLHLSNRNKSSIQTLEGVLQIDWLPWSDRSDPPVPKTITVSQATFLERQGPPPFVQAARIEAKDLTTGKPRIHPLIVHDLNNDGLAEVILAGVNIVHWNLGKGQFKRAPFLKHWQGEIGEGATLADFNGDHFLDLICVTVKDRSPVVFLGDQQGMFNQEPLISENIKLSNPSAITAGDIDRDGDLDVWLSQYKGAYTDGQMPTPYFDANDGYPSFLLINDGGGRFSDGTEQAGLTTKRNRRTYSNSFVDLDGDRDLDLMVVSDFSGVDLYQNDGQGHFRDVRDQWLGEWHNFGMAHTFGDYDQDGALDFFVIGMSSTTMRRLESLGLNRPGFKAYGDARPVMGYGNRMYLSRGNHFIEPAFRANVARTGWSWGCATLDFENDGDDDIYVANGFMSGESCADYCSTFWRHDIYTGNSQSNPEVAQLLNLSQRPVREAKISWNGFEKNEFLMNQQGRSFEDVAHLLGVALPLDCRAVVANDLDLDGKQDLLIVEEKWSGNFKKDQRLHIFVNQSQNKNHWIGVNLKSQGSRSHLLGTKITIVTDTGERTRQIVSGDSFFAQHAATAHFGLGLDTKVKSLEIQWASGAHSQIIQPKINQYHLLEPSR